MMDAEAVAKFTSSFAPKFHRTARDVVFLHLRAVSDFLSGTFDHKGAADGTGETRTSTRRNLFKGRAAPRPSRPRRVIWSIGNAAFSHAHKGGPTFIGVKGLLAAGGELGRVYGFDSTAVSVLEDMSSQLMICCSRQAERVDGNYKTAKCSHCKCETHRDVNAAANMLRILAYRIIFGKREECYKRRTKKAGSDKLERLSEEEFNAKYVDKKPIKEALAEDDFGGEAGPSEQTTPGDSGESSTSSQ